MGPRLDFGYSRAWTYGHAATACVLLLACGACLWLGLPPWVCFLVGAGGAWAAAGALVMLCLGRHHRPLQLPVERFLDGGQERVLDMGCGSGRATIMVAAERPDVTVTALDDFSARYIRDHGEERLIGNLEIAGVSQRVQVRRGDMRQMPFEDDSFDGIVSTYAIDHLRQDAPAALGEAGRVLRPGGQLLLWVIVPNVWMLVAFGPFVVRMRSRAEWRRLLAGAGFQLEDEGSARATAWFLARRIG